MSVARSCRKSYTILGLTLITNNVSHPSPAGATESFDGGFGFVGSPEIENPAQRLRKKTIFYENVDWQSAAENAWYLDAHWGVYGLNNFVSLATQSKDEWIIFIIEKQAAHTKKITFNLNSISQLSEGTIIGSQIQRCNGKKVEKTVLDHPVH
jgi:hypothetical protein